MKWKCQLCGYVFEGETPPESCPGIVKHKSRFVESRDYIEVTNKRGETKKFPKTYPVKVETTTVQEKPRVITVQVEHTTADELRNQGSQTVSIPVTHLPMNDEVKPKHITIPVKHTDAFDGLKKGSEYISIPITPLQKDDEEEKPEYISIPVKPLVEEDTGVDYAAEYKKQTGRDIETGEYTTQ